MKLRRPTLGARSAGRSGTAATPRARGARGWVVAGALAGATFALVRYAPAAWAADAISGASGGRLMLADAQGTVWDGDALLVLTGGAGSRDALALPTRLSWTLRPALSGLRVTLAHPCCLPQPVQWRIDPGWRRVKVALATPGQPLAQWPASWLAGLGAPWNTLQPGGLLQFASSGMGFEIAQGRWRFEGAASIDVLNASSSVSTLDRLGSYHVAITGAAGDGGTAMTLNTLDGALQLSGNGQTTPSGFRFRGEARAAPGQELALNNLLNIIGRRNGAISVISIG